MAARPHSTASRPPRPDPRPRDFCAGHPHKAPCQRGVDTPRPTRRARSRRPAAPTQFSHRINPDGTLTLRWKARQPRGVVGVQYGVSRRLAGESTFTLVDIVGSEKQWTDETLPAGIAGVAYLVQPQRGGRGGVTGPAGNMHVVQFGVPGARGAALQMAA